MYRSHCLSIILIPAAQITCFQASRTNIKEVTDKFKIQLTLGHHITPHDPISIKN